VIFTESNDGAAVELRPGQPFTVRLAENPTTGYRWRIEDWDRPVLALAGDEYHAPEDLLHGASGEHEWHFRAREPGAATLRLVYGRSWSKDNPARTYSLSVTVS